MVRIRCSAVDSYILNSYHTHRHMNRKEIVEYGRFSRLTLKCEYENVKAWFVFRRPEYRI